MKKKYPNIVSSIPYEPRHDNHTSGVLDKPDYKTDPSNGYGDGKFSFTELVGKGESCNPSDVYVQNANGVSSSKGKDKGRQYNWGNGDAGTWNDNDFDNGNLTGL